MNQTLHSPLLPVPILLQGEEDPFDDILLVLCGTGGTGSWLAPHLARLTWQLNRTWQQLEAPRARRRRIKLTFIDPDSVEMGNVEARQNFSPADVSYPKASVLAVRYGLAYGLQIGALVECFDPALVASHGTTIILGCVDNADARQAIAKTLVQNVGTRWPRVWWVDAGNARTSGQILLGNTAAVERLAGALQGTFCGRVPSPALLEPSLLVKKPEEEEGEKSLSCEELTLANLQSPTINAHMAAWLYTYVHGLLCGGLTICATYTSLEVGTTRSVETSAQAWAALFDKEPAFFLQEPAQETRREEQELLEEGEE